MAAQHQQRHQVLEHRAAPRHQRGAALDAHQRAREPEPVLLRHLAPGDGDEAGEPGFRRQQVVVRGVEAARPLGVGEPEADREDPALAVVEELPVHGVGERVAATGEVRGGARAGRRVGAVAVVHRRSASSERPVPLGDLVGLGPGRRVRCDPLQRRAQGLRAQQRVLEPVARRLQAGEHRAQRLQLAQRGAAVLAQRRGRVRPWARAASESARTPAVSRAPALSRCRSSGSSASWRSPAASAISAPARLPLSTVET